MAFKVEPIDLLNDLMQPAMALKEVKAGDCVARKLPTGGVTLSWRMAIELAIEAAAYKEFYQTANQLAMFVDHKQKKGYVSQHTMQEAQDLYIQARDKCRRLATQSGVDIHEVLRRK